MNILKTLSKRKLLVIGGAIVTMLIVLISYSLLSMMKPELMTRSSHNVAQTNENKQVYGLPVRLQVPSIGIDAPINQVGLTSQGDLDVPAGPDSTGWYKSGPRPGEVGSAVIDGHFGWKDEIPAVFDNLHKLKKGDVVRVEDENGKTITFTVSGSHTYTPDENAEAVFRSSDEKAHLNLITCQGDWNQDQKSYAERLVVFTSKKQQ